MAEDFHGSATQIGPSMAPKLEVTRGDNKGETYRVKLKTKIGRERDNDIILLDPKVSRYHAQISIESGRWTLTDLGSANRTYLNGNAVTTAMPLRSGDRIAFGELELAFKIPGILDEETQPTKAAASPSPTPAPAASPATSAGVSPGQKPGPGVPPRITWIAGGFVLLLCLAAVSLMYFMTNRPSGTPHRFHRRSCPRGRRWRQQRPAARCRRSAGKPGFGLRRRFQRLVWRLG